MCAFSAVAAAAVKHTVHERLTRNNAGSYTIIPLEKISLRAGKNILAVAAKNKDGDQYLDAGLIDLGK